ncbi:substrate-binding domain-containing protein [Vogesella sp. LIG4]|uniref:substrate-binding domain-containing protein n=1 Tax=Vogesella sp. LIG4 TaxID=1192162 RepID=UPI0008201D13|nr:substrate-binding domain-containing protein [Vogesella sp. LIG4]SCK25314.1 monosaccharide ABC transporter substrate-binding protein, CUT2 family [Vogesella sp. LIG4]
MLSRLLRHSLLLLAMLYPPAAPAQPGNWDGPTSGPHGQGPKVITFIAQDYRNGGISGVLRAFNNAATTHLGWRVNNVDGKGDASIIRDAITHAIEQDKPDAIVLGGFQANDFKDLVQRAHQAGIQLAGWHAGAKPGPAGDLLVNITTDAMDVARLAANYAISSSGGKVGAVIITDTRFEIAIAKAAAMCTALTHCASCRCLTIQDVAISRASTDTDSLITRMNARFGKQWTHTLAINDIYFDEMNFPLRRAGRGDIRNIAAGDGSHKAISRIRSGLSQQIATVAEPLNAQGWQLADELNRAFAGQPPSGYVSRPILVTRTQPSGGNNAEIDADLGYQEAYTRIWQAP